MNEFTFEQLPKAVTQLYEKLNTIENLLLNQSNRADEDQLLTIQQTGELLKLSVPTLYGYVSRNEIPFSKKGKRLYFSRKDILAWVSEGHKKTVSEVRAEANTYVKKK
jgi:excisionase family DNA binding protein